MTAAIELVGITKRFPGVIANDNVNLRVEAGEIHAICGENGAGKSTLMKILYGMQAADEGTMKIHDQEVHFDSPTDAIASGIGMVHQHFMLADQMTVLENVILGSEPTTPRGLIDFEEAERHLREVGDAYGLTIDPDDLVETLEVGEKQRVEIIKVLFRGAKILILDEPTAVLVPQEVEELFRNLRELQADGSTIIFIDHKLQEVLEIADRITVIRRGKTVTTVDADSVTAADLAELMVGSELPSPATTDSTVTDEIVLEVEALTVVDEDGRAAVDDVSLRVHRGEVLGVAGIEGNGQAELIDAIIGTADPSSGRIVLEGTDITHTSVRHRRPASGSYRRTATPKACCSMRHCGKTLRSATRRRRRTPRVCGSTVPAHVSEPRRSVPSTTCGRRASRSVPGRSPAAISRSSSSAARWWPSRSCSWRRTPPGASTSAPRPTCGARSVPHAPTGSPRC